MEIFKNPHRFIPYLWVIFSLISFQTLAKNKPLLQLAKSYSIDNTENNLDIKDYWVSEKLDGVRGRWTGSRLITRQGHLINAPITFTKNWPNVALDGEIWLGRNKFEQVSGIVRRKTPTIEDWQNIRFMVFDLPEHLGDFSERISAMHSIITKVNSPHLQMVEQNRIVNLSVLAARLDKVVNAKGEGLMLHHQAAFYQFGRSNKLLKLKKHYDSEATVLAHLPGKGKYKGKMGALLVQTKEGIRFKIGTGFNDQQRMTPPPIGCIITFKYFGKSQKGVPKFASFMRIRHINSLESSIKIKG